MIRICKKREFCLLFILKQCCQTNHFKNKKMISELEKALECVLALEEIYSSKNTKKKQQQNINSSSFTVEANTYNLSTYSADFPLTGIEAVDVLLKGGVPRTRTNNNVTMPSMMSMNHIQQQQDSASNLRKEAAKRNWKELDRLLVSLSRRKNDDDDKNTDVVVSADEKRNRKILSDVLKGRPDRWVRVASVAEKEAKKRDIQQYYYPSSDQEQENDDDAAKAVNHTETSEVVLGSAASSISRMILYTLLNS